MWVACVFEWGIGYRPRPTIKSIIALCLKCMGPEGSSTEITAYANIPPPSQPQVDNLPILENQSMATEDSQ